MLGENASPLNRIKGFRCWKLLIAVQNRAAPPIGSVAVLTSTLYISLKCNITRFWLIFSPDNEFIARRPTARTSRDAYNNRSVISELRQYRIILNFIYFANRLKSRYVINKINTTAHINWADIHLLQGMCTLQHISVSIQRQLKAANFHRRMKVRNPLLCLTNRSDCNGFKNIAIGQWMISKKYKGRTNTNFKNWNKGVFVQAGQDIC